MKDEIDFFKLEKNIKKALMIRNLKFPENRFTPEISLLLDELGFMSFKGSIDYLKFLGSSLLLVSTILLYENIKQKNRKINYDTAIIIQDALRKTDTYKICLETYNNYLDKYTDLLKKFGISSGDEVSILYQYMLDSGLLSYDKKYHYEKELMTKRLHKYIGLYELDELTGCKIATGVGVCRHSSSQLTDIQNRVGNASCNFYVEGISDDFTIDKYKLRKINHQYTITKDQEQRYFGYCTTSRCFVHLDFDFGNRYIHASTIPLIEGEISYETIIPLDFNLQIHENEMVVRDLLYRKNESYKDIDPILLTDKHIEIENLIQKNKNAFEEFYQNTKKDLEIISDSYNHIVPSTSKIKELKIR